MNRKIKLVTAALLTVSLGTPYLLAADATPKKHLAKKHAVTKESGVTEEQLQKLREELQGQIDNLKGELSTRDTQLHQAQQQAADAQTAAIAAQQAASAQQGENAQAVSTLQATVADLKTNQVSIATTIQDDQTNLKKAIETPDAIHFKGITISPTGSFLEGATVWRSAAVVGDINTPLTGIPLQASENGHLSEFFGTGRHSRLAIKAVGKLDNMTLTGYYEMDWMGAGVTSNNNQSNSYVMRQRQLWAQAALASGWTFTAGQMWSLAAEDTKGLQNLSEIQPAVIDPQYNAGYVWARQFGFRVTKDFSKKFFAGISFENPQTLAPSGTSLPSNVLVTAPGTGGGLYNSTATYSYNLAPDMLLKLAFEPGWGHWEVFSVNRFFRDRIYPTTGSAHTDVAIGNGIGGGFRGPIAGKYASFALKGLWGKGMGRYGDSTIADVTLAPSGNIVPLKAFSALSTLEVTPTPRLQIYMNYGGDYVYRHYTGKVGYGSPLTDMSGCNTEAAATSNNAYNSTGTCSGNNKDLQEASAGYWYDIYRGPKGRLRQGLSYSYFTRNLWSGAGGTTNPSNTAEGTDNMVETSFRYYLP